MKRTKEYRRFVAEKNINRKKSISRNIYHFDWYDNSNQYSKNKIFCSCWMCAHRNAYYDWLESHGVKDEFKEELKEADLDIKIPNRLQRRKKYGNKYSHYSKNWN